MMQQKSADVHNTVTQYVIMNVTNAQTQKNGTRNKQSNSRLYILPQPFGPSIITDVPGSVHCSLRHRVPAYLADYCVPVSAVPGHHHLRSDVINRLFHVFTAAPSGLVHFL